MRALRVVGITEEGGELSVVLEDPGRRERYVVPADEHLRAAARGDLTRLGQIAIELESQLRPREIQARIRAGASVEQVASAAGVPTSKIERFAYPVLLERSRTAEVAQRAHPMRAEGPDSRMLGDVVAHTFGLRGQDYTGGEWDSWKGEDGRWVVVLSWRAGRSDNAAHWTFQPGAHGGTVTALDEHASDLVEGLPQRPLRTVGPVIDMNRPEDAPTQPERVAAPIESRRTADGTDAPPPITARTETRTPERRTLPPAPPAPPAQRQAEPVVRTPQPEAAVPPPAPEPKPKPDPAPEPAPAAQTPEPAAEEPETAAKPTEESAAPAARRTKKGKPVMPSWDEVLLGVRGQR
jgi:hypothetical protein